MINYLLDLLYHLYFPVKRERGLGLVLNLISSELEYTHVLFLSLGHTPSVLLSLAALGIQADRVEGWGLVDQVGLWDRDLRALLSPRA